MGQSDKPLLIGIIEPDAPAQTALAAVQIVGIQFSFLTRDERHSPHDPFANADAVIVAVDQPHGLDLVASLCARPGMPPVIAVGGRGHAGQSLEHVLLLAEVRGAAATLVKPFTPQELAAVAFSVCNLRPHPDRAGQASRPDEPAPLAGRAGKPDWPVA